MPALPAIYLLVTLYRPFRHNKEKETLHMIDKAIAKITKEAMEINDPVAFGIEEHLTEICTSSSVAMKILAEDKSLKGIYDKVWAEARKRRKGNCVFIPPAEVYAMIDEYYEISSSGSQTQRPARTRANVLDLI
uniref:Uncharacterized protein n=1 Tax=uncultured bacterium Contig643 TaxID=1393602 RepID=W0FM29_9BACT|nr:hypothetical protein [uncultured bacterium Contig643]